MSNPTKVVKEGPDKDGATTVIPLAGPWHHWLGPTAEGSAGGDTTSAVLYTPLAQVCLHWTVSNHAMNKKGLPRVLHFTVYHLGHEHLGGNVLAS